jgi:hypothetical protein
MLPVVQDALSELLATLELARKPAVAVLVISGTTVWLVDRVVAGMFSKRLFYQLNTIHLMPGDDSLEVAPG